jgi:hypothetical protein
MKLHKSYITVLGLVALLGFTACGGGGGGSSDSTVDFKDISYHVPVGVKVLTPNASSEKSKLFLAGENGEVSGFFITEDSQVNKKSKLEEKQFLEKILYSNIDGGSLGRLSLISAQKITSPYEHTVSHYKMSTYTPMKPLALSEKLLYQITGDSNIEPLNSSDGTEASEFRVIYTKGIKEGVSFQLVSITPALKYEHYESMCNTITNGARVTSKDAIEKNESQTFKAKAGNKKADFLFVIDDSGSMADDQDALSKSASDFTAEMRQSGLNYRSAIITTSSQYSTRYTLGAYHILNSVGIIENNEELLKKRLVAGIYGSNTETGIYNAEKALRSIAHGDSEDGEVTKLGMPLSDATLSVIIISDEDSQYRKRAGYQFDIQNNLFLDRKIRVYSIISSNRFDPYDNNQYDDLANKTGGSIADIRNTNSSGELDYSDIMKQIAKDAGGVASTFILDYSAISIIEVAIDGKVIAEDAKNGYTYNASSKSIVLHGTALPKSDFSISIYYKTCIEK